MPRAACTAMLVAALLACLALAATAAAASTTPRLVAQIAQVTPTATPGGAPPLSGKPPTTLGKSKSKSNSGSSSTKTAHTGKQAAATPLPKTGSDAGMLALAGFALLGWGVALRLRLRDAA